MLDCEFRHLCDGDCESCGFAKEQEQRQALCDAVENLKNEIIEAFTPLLDAMEKFIKKLLGRKNHNEKN